MTKVDQVLPVKVEVAPEVKVIHKRMQRRQKLDRKSVV